MKTVRYCPRVLNDPGTWFARACAVGDAEPRAWKFVWRGSLAWLAATYRAIPVLSGVPLTVSWTGAPPPTGVSATVGLLFAAASNRITTPSSPGVTVTFLMSKSVPTRLVVVALPVPGRNTELPVVVGRVTVVAPGVARASPSVVTRLSGGSHAPWLNALSGTPTVTKNDQ